ncbi:hypothetical protein RF11_12713 [Thelohanellus kitauei]|uniref:26S proteasome non-ATPase regulatory subunit 4 n=1 Tax=Thelohanellus kitauei TaxID=669202 RepID=A0A0C2IMQ6_THEKT|nr:hypothetical protein RF11_12713 [Thelohanellus kitauei]
MLRDFIEVLNISGNNENHIVVVDPGECLVSNVQSSEIMPTKQRMNPASGDMDMDVDPDLAEAIRLSMQDMVVKNKEQQSVDPLIHDSFLPETNEIDIEGMTEEQQIEWAMRLSLKESQKTAESGVKIEEVEMAKNEAADNVEGQADQNVDEDTKPTKMDED